ncbi:MAG: ferredoxin reductase family protein [Opitutaceae bacterium]|nr:ferredoxin reductase family protein [Opitutaceae bacterium]
MSSDETSGQSGALARMLAYVVIVLSPLIIVALVRPATDHSFVYTIGKNLALVGFAIFAMQFVLSARLKWIERPFGLNLLFSFHKTMAVVASLLVLSHPVLLVLGGGKRSLVLGPEVNWHIWLGRIAMVVILFHVMLASFRLIIRLNYETWRFIHNVVALVFLPLAFLHSWKAGGDLQLPAMRVLWVMLFGSAVAAYGWHRFVRPLRLRREPYTVTDLRKEADGVWTIALAAPVGVPRFDFLPGQFQFLTFRRAAHLPVEEHHWTISSSPTETGVLRTTIKESGDFTATIGETKPGDTALVCGPFGRFSYALHPEQRDLVFLAGGIGITPLMAMLRHIRDTQAKRTVTLLYGNTNEQDITFRDELAEMERTGVASLKVVHILSKPSAEWRGERGRLDAEMVAKLCRPLGVDRAYYLCAPPAAMSQAIRVLRQAGVPPRRIHFERFSL